jgi:ribosomal protein S27AE
MAMVKYEGLEVKTAFCSQCHGDLIQDTDSVHCGTCGLPAPTLEAPAQPAHIKVDPDKDGKAERGRRRR